MLNIIKWRIIIFYKKRILVLLFLILPILIAILSASSIEKKQMSHIDISIIDEDNTKLSQIYIDRLIKDDKIYIIRKSYIESIKELEKEKISAILLIKKDFSKNLINSGKENLIDLIYSKDNPYIKPMSDIFIQHFFRELVKYRNINYVLKNYPDSIVADEYMQEYEKKLADIERKNLFEFNFNIQEINSEGLRQEKPEGTNTLLVKYILGIIYLFSYILILTQSIEQDKNIKPLLSKISLSNRGWLPYSLGNLLGSFIPIFINLSIQIFVFFNIIKKDFTPEIFLYIIAFALSITLFSMVLVKFFNKEDNLYIFIPYLILGIWIFGDMLVSLEFISFLNIDYGILPGINAKNIITNMALGNNLNLSKNITVEFIYFFILLLIYGGYSYKELNYGTSRT